MKIAFGRVAAVAGLLAAAAGSARADVGETAGTVLLQPPAARPAGLGEAYAAESGRVDGLLYNPAALGGLGGWQFGAMYAPGFAGDGYVSALAGREFRGYGVGAAVVYDVSGQVDQLDPTGRVTTVTGERDTLLQVGVARRFPTLGLSLGVSGKLLESTLLETTSATDLATDYGAQWEIQGTPVVAGVSLQHVGGHLAFDLANERLPELVRVAFAARHIFGEAGSRMAELTGPGSPYPTAPRPPHALEAVAEYTDRLAEHAASVQLGFEYEYARVVALRGGTRLLTLGAPGTSARVTLGLGVTLGEFHLDYAGELLPFTVVHRVSLSLTPKEEDS